MSNRFRTSGAALAAACLLGACRGRNGGSGAGTAAAPAADVPIPAVPTPPPDRMATPVGTAGSGRFPLGETSGTTTPAWVSHEFPHHRALGAGMHAGTHAGRAP